MSDDPIDDLLSIGMCFDWITPIWRTLAGYNTLEFEGDAVAAMAMEEKLKAQGIDCKLETMPLSGICKVVSKR